MENDVEIKQSMYKEFENPENIINIKDKLFSVISNMKESELNHSKTFQLEDTMSAYVINHFKMDPHCHNEKIFCDNDEQKKLEKLFSFNYNETLYTIFDLFKKEMTLIYGGGIAQCYLENVYSFINEENININKLENDSDINYNIITTFILSFKYMIFLLFHSINKTAVLHEEDVTSFYYANSVLLNKPKSLEFIEVIQNKLNLLINNDKEINDKNIIEQIMSILNIQKNLLKLIKIFFKEDGTFTKLDFNKENFETFLHNILSEIDNIKLDIFPKEIDDKKTLYQKEIYKLMPSLNSKKLCSQLSSEESLIKLKRLIEDFKKIRIIFNETNLYHLYKLIHEINFYSNKNDNPSFIIRHIIDLNIINQDDEIFHNKNTKNNFKHLLNLYDINSKIDKKDDKDELATQLIGLYKDILRYELRNKARKIREVNEMVDNIIGFLFFIFKKEKEKTKDQKNFITNFIVFQLLQKMLGIILDCFFIDFFKFHELDYIFFICETISSQMLVHNYFLATRFDKKDILQENNIPGNLNKSNLPKEQLFIFDNMNIFNSYKFAFQSLKLLLYYLKKFNLIKQPNLREKDIIARINNRFPCFKNCGIFINISYEAFQNDYKDNMEIIDSNNYIDDAKELLKTASNYLAELKKADIELRDSFMYSNDEINNLNKVMISNTLIFNKIKKFKEEHKEGEYLNLVFNLNKYKSRFPLIEINK